MGGKNISKNIIFTKTIVPVIALIIVISIFSPIKGIIIQHPCLLTNSGKTLYVGGSGPGNYSTIQAAINAADAGDTVFVYNDSSPYYETLVVDKSIYLIGEEKNTTIIDGHKNDEHIIALAVGNSTVSGFTIQHSRTGKDGIWIESDNNLILNCNLIDNDDEGIYIGDGSKNNNHISRCYFRGNYYPGIYIHGWKDKPASNNVISYCMFDEDDIYLRYAPHTIISHCKLHGEFSDISVWLGADHCLIANCTFDSAGGHAIYIDADFSTISNCIINNTGGSSIYFYGYYGAKTIKIFNCTVTNSKSYGIVLTESKNCIISGCHLENNTWAGIGFLCNPVNTEVYDCNFVDNDYAIAIHYINFFNRFYRNNFINDMGEINPRYNCVFMLNFYIENYWSDWKGVGPYHVHGFLNWDWHPAQEPYNHFMKKN
jgi:parallel beta-helix repeat protein